MGTCTLMTKDLKKAETELEELSNEWDRLDSQGAMTKEQIKILKDMEILEKDIKGIKYTIKLMNW